MDGAEQDRENLAEEQLMIRYLLRELPEDDRAAVQERFFTDPEFAGRLRAVESELIDAYARGEVAADRRNRVEQFLLSASPQREKLAIARAFHQVLREQEEQPRWAWLSLPRLRVLTAASLAFALLFVAVALFLLRENQRMRREIAVLEAGKSSPRETNPPGPAPQPFAVLLAPGLRRDGATLKEVSIPIGTQVVRLDMELDRGDENQRYLVTIATQEGRQMWRQEPLESQARGSGFVAEMWLPTRVLQPGVYELTLNVLSPAGNPRVLQYYTFAVRQ